MGRGKHQAAAVEVGVDQGGDQRFALGVERGGRFVEEPERAVEQQQPGEHQPAGLAGGEVAGIKGGDRPEADGLEGRQDRGGWPAVEGSPEAEVLGDRQARLDRGAVAEKTDGGFAAFLRIAATDGEAACGRMDDAGNDQQQRRFSRPVGAAQLDDLAGI